MKDVIFTVREDLGDRGRDEILHHVQQLPGISASGPLKPESKRPDFRAVCYARVLHDESAEEVADALRSLPGVESAEVPPLRKLP